jgi:hypothetical protein
MILALTKRQVKYNYLRSLQFISLCDTPDEEIRLQNYKVDTATVLQAGRNGVRILAGARDFSLLRNMQTGSGAHPASYSMGTGALPG